MSKSLIISFLAGFLLAGVAAFFLLPKPPAPPESASLSQKSDCKVVATVKTNPDGSKEESLIFNSSSVQKAEAGKRPDRRISIIPIYSFKDSVVYYAGSVEKKYSLPLLGDVFLGVFGSTKLDAGIVISKEF